MNCVRLRITVKEKWTYSRKNVLACKSENGRANEAYKNDRQPQCSRRTQALRLVRDDISSWLEETIQETFLSKRRLCWTVICEKCPGSSFLTVKQPLITTSYFSIMTEGKFDLKLILEFDGSASGPSIIKWMEKAELVCKMCQVKHMELIIPLRLMGGAFTVFQQLKEEDKRDFERIKAALYTAFAVDGFMAFDQFVERWLHHGNLVDVYLAELRRLLVLFGGISDQGLACTWWKVFFMPQCAWMDYRSTSNWLEHKLAWKIIQLRWDWLLQPFKQYKMRLSRLTVGTCMIS